MNLKLTMLVALSAAFFGACQTHNHPPASRSISKAPGAPLPPKLKELVESYQEDRLYGTKRTAEGLPIVSDAALSSKRYLGIDYADLVRRSAHGDSASLEKLMGLSMDGMAGEEHAATLVTLLEGLGDKAFAASLRRCTPGVRKSVREEIDFTRQGSEAQARARFPETFGK